jgi:hypothetical protein
MFGIHLFPFLCNILLRHSTRNANIYEYERSSSSSASIQGKPYMACSDSEYELLKFMNLFGHLVGLLGQGISPME